MDLLQPQDCNKTSILSCSNILEPYCSSLVYMWATGVLAECTSVLKWDCPTTTVHTHSLYNLTITCTHAHMLIFLPFPLTHTLLNALWLGDGRYVVTASIRGWMPLFRSALPHTTGTPFPPTAHRRKAAYSWGRRHVCVTWGMRRLPCATLQCIVKGSE